MASLVVFAGIAPILVILPGDVTFVGTLYAFGATLSFTVAHASIVRAARTSAEQELLRYTGAAEPPDRRESSGRSSRSSAASRPSSRSLVILVQNPTTRWVGLGWLVFGLVGYMIYRRRFVHAP